MTPVRRPAPAKETLLFAGAREQGHRHQQRELLRKEGQGAEDTRQQPSVTASACHCCQCEPKCEDVLWVKVALNAHPHRQKTCNHNEGHRFPAATPTSGRP